MSDCERIQRVLDDASPGATAEDALVAALMHAVDCADCRSRPSLGELVPHTLAQAAFESYADALGEDRVLLARDALAELHVAACDDCGQAFSQLLAARSVTASPPLDAIFEQVTAEFLVEDDPVIRRRARNQLHRREQRGVALTPETKDAMARSIPSPKDYPRIALAATIGLRQGPMSTMARLIHELTPYLREHQPHLYILEGSFQLILRCGLLRGYPDHLLHCVAPGTLGGLTDLGAALAGESVVGLEDIFGSAGKDIASRLDLDWGIDCVVYLIDPTDAVSTQADTLSLKRECALTNTPFLDTYTSAIEFFGLLHAASNAPAPRNGLADDLREPLGYDSFPHDVVGLVAHDTHKPALLQFARDNVDFLMRFKQRLGTETTAMLLNGKVPDRVDHDPVIAHATEQLREARKGVDDRPFVVELASGREGGNMQIAEAVAMGICDSVLLLEEPRPRGDNGRTHRLIEYNARISNQPDRLNTSGKQMLIHDPRTAAVWAELWEQFPRGGPATLETAYRETFGIELVLARLPEGRDHWASIAKEAAWYLLSAIANHSSAGGGTRGTRVTVACGSAMRDITDNIGGGGESQAVATMLCERIDAHQQRYQAAIAGCKADYPQFTRRIDQLAHRRRLTLVAHPDDVELWSIGNVTVAPMVGQFGASGHSLEATSVARRLANTLRGHPLELDEDAFQPIRESPSLPPELHRHWATTDIAIVTGRDLSPEVFGSSGSPPVPLRRGMFDELESRGAVGEIAGLYLDADGQPVPPDGLARQGMRLEHLQRIVDTGDGGASILVGGAETADDDDSPPPRARTVLAALRAGAVSVFISEPAFATAVLREHVRQATGTLAVGARDA